MVGNGKAVPSNARGGSTKHDAADRVSNLNTLCIVGQDNAQSTTVIFCRSQFAAEQDTRRFEPALPLFFTV